MEDVHVKNSYLTETFHGSPGIRMNDFKNLNQGADFWRNEIGQNVLPSSSKNKITYEKWKDNGWQNHPIPLEQHEKWKIEGAFDEGLMVMPGTPWHRPDKIGYYLVCVDWDKQLGFDELFEGKSIEQISKDHFIEQHLDDLTRGHFWFYSPIIFHKKSADDILGLEVKGLGSHGVMIACPSIHMNGYPIQRVGCQEPKTLTRDESFTLLLHLDKICKNYSIPYLDKNGSGSACTLSNDIKSMIKSFDIDSRIEIHEGQRHETMISIANSILFRYSKKKNHKKLEEFFRQINNELCTPEPLPEREISKIWEDALEYVSRAHKQEQKEQQQQRQGTELVWIPDEVKQELKNHKWALICHSPQTFMIAHSKLFQTLDAKCDSSYIETKQASGPVTKAYFLKLRKAFINAIPIEVTTYEDPISLTLDHRYKIKFRTYRGKIVTSRGGPATLDAIVTELVDKALIYSAQEGKEALSRIINSFENDGSLRISHEIETPGFYLIDGRIKAFQIDIKNHTQIELAEAAQFLNELVEKHYRKEIPATTIKWGTVAPFDYALKQYTDDLCWIPWIGLAGFPRSGKSTQGRIACGMWEHYYHGIKWYLPFTTVDTEARLGNKIGLCTLPMTFHECDGLNDEKNRKILEMMKNCMETRVSRGKYETRTTYVDEPALAPCLLTSNPPFPAELGFRSRIIYIVYTKDDKYWDEMQKKEFIAFVSKGRKNLRVYGDFVAKYILNNQQVILKENIQDCDWKQTSESVLQEFYKAAGLPIPDWVNLWVDESDVTEAAIQEANETAHFEIRGFLVQATNNGYRIDPDLDYKDDRNIEVSFQEKLDRCLKKQLVPYLHKHNSRSGVSDVVITHDIVRELKRNKISNITTMQALSREIPNFQYEPLKLNGGTARVVRGPYEDFIKFLDCDFKDEGDSTL